MWTMIAGLAYGAAPEQHFAWDLTVAGKAAGSRELTLRELGRDGRMLESYTSVVGSVGPIAVRYQQRMTAHATTQPADFTSVADENGAIVEVQGRYQPTTWALTVTTNGETEPRPVPAQRVALSTADLLDPRSAVSLDRLTGPVDILVAETGDVMSGTVERLGASKVDVKGVAVPVQGFAWTGPQGRWEFYYAEDGVLVRFRTKMAGVEVEGLLREIPAGADDFPLSSTPSVEAVAE